MIVFNRVPSRSQRAHVVMNEVKERGLPVARTTLGNRNAFGDSFFSGRGVAELAPGKAREEILALYGECNQIING